MNKELPCYIISDLLPLYQDDLLSEQTKKDIDTQFDECKECKEKMDAMEMQVAVQTTLAELKTNPLKKVRFYQKVLTALGAFTAFIFGACYPIAILGFAVLERGEIAPYQIARIKHLWYVLALRSFGAGIVVCAMYFLLVLLIGKIIGRNTASKMKG